MSRDPYGCTGQMLARAMRKLAADLSYRIPNWVGEKQIPGHKIDTSWRNV